MMLIIQKCKKQGKTISCTQEPVPQSFSHRHKFVYFVQWPLRAPEIGPDIFSSRMSFEDFVRGVPGIPGQEADIHLRSRFTIMQSPWKPDKMYRNHDAQVLMAEE